MSRMTIGHLLASVLLCSEFIFGLGAPVAYAEVLAWVRQPGTSLTEHGSGVSADGLGNVYITGDTNGSLGGPNAGGDDAFVSKYDAAGNLQWIRQFGTSLSDNGQGVSADGLGNVYVSGETAGNLGGPNAGAFDAFVRKYDAAGILQWTKQQGTAEQDLSFGVSADGLGNVYTTGYTEGSLGGPNAGDNDAFLSKYDSAGNLQWTRQLGTTLYDISNGVSADGLGNVYISGETAGSLDGTNTGDGDAFVSKYDAAGNLQWTRQPETSTTDDISTGVSADDLGNVYISGYSFLHSTPFDGLPAFVTKYDAAGNFQWTKQNASYSYSFGVSADGLGNVYISGTDGDALVSEYDAAGNLLWTLRLGTSQDDQSRGVSADGLGNVYTVGGTEGNLNGGFKGGTYDVIVAKYSVPEPGSWLLATFASTFVICIGKWRNNG